MPDDTIPLAASLVLRPPLSDLRAYIHAADLFDALAVATGAAGPTFLRLSRISDEAVELRHDAPRPGDPDFCGLFGHAAPGRPLSGWLRRLPGEVVRARAPLMDAEVIPGAEFGMDGARVRRRPGCSVARTAVLLAVALLEELFPDDTWNLAEITAERGEETGADIGGEPVAVRIARQMSRFLVVEVTADERYWGRFTLAATPLRSGTV
ncbi:hypothetical protein MWN33_02190 [Starkeya koreensis]|uniref:Uncharacterized protein n=1 Tax=Ancylobacter koreensis TaxID=266121 RepID=A0ABT0DHS8_9HYPH|nr:hypothetical protein [Ancylobacter koreensis]MCK0206836.1 hypothetical protein [Ancylobacter koreensis]